MERPSFGTKSRLFLLRIPKYRHSVASCRGDRKTAPRDTNFLLEKCAGVCRDNFSKQSLKNSVSAFAWIGRRTDHRLGNSRLGLFSPKRGRSALRRLKSSEIKEASWGLRRRKRRTAWLYWHARKKQPQFSQGYRNKELHKKPQRRTPRAPSLTTFSLSRRL